MLNYTCDTIQSVHLRLPLGPYPHEVWHIYAIYTHNLFVDVIWLKHVCDVTHSYMWHDSIMCNVTCSFTCTFVILWHDSNHVCDVTQSYVWNDLIIFVAWRVLPCVPPYFSGSWSSWDVATMIGCLKLHVSFRKRAIICGDVLRSMIKTLVRHGTRDAFICVK